MNYHNYQNSIDACLQCVALCQHCASEDLKEKHNMANCVQTNMECAAICGAAASLMSLGSIYAKEICKLCVQVCTRCADECAKHDHKHCKECAEACRKCAAECSKV